MIVIEHLCQSFEQENVRIRALEDINMHIRSGEYVILKGASGSGKSTLLSLIAGLQRPVSGSIIVDHQAVAKLSEAYSAKFRQETIGFIFQKYHLIAGLSVEENIAIPLIPTRLSPKEVQANVKAVMEQFHIAHKAKIRIRHLSGGEQQRVAIARALVCSPKILLADEPTANLDAHLKDSLKDYLEAIKHKGVTIVLATHDESLIEQACVDRVIELNNGRIIDDTHA